MTSKPDENLKPNVLFIFADQLGAVWTGCYGNPDVATPHLDRLAASGTRFDRAYTASPLCTPYRGTLFTGRYPSQTGILRNSQRIPGCETTLADLFNQGGYQTCYVGKWHLAGPPTASRWVPPVDRGGFQDFVGWECYHVRHWNNTIFERDSAEPIVMPGHDTDGITDFALERLRHCAEANQPFCMFISHQAPHPVCEAPEPYGGMYRGRQFHWRPNSQPESGFDHYGCQFAGQKFLEDYFAEVTHLDAAVGRVLDELEKLGLAENTIVVFTSDHGEMASSHGRYEKLTMYEESLRVPLLVRVPGQPGGAVSQAPVSSVDYLPTLLDLCGLEPASTAEGVSFAEQLRDPAAPVRRESVFVQLTDKAAILQGSYTLELSPDGGEVRQLLDIESDPSQLRDFKDAPAYRDLRDRLAGDFREWLADIRTRIGDPDEAAAPTRTDSDPVKR